MTWPIWRVMRECRIWTVIDIETLRSVRLLSCRRRYLRHRKTSATMSVTSRCRMLDIICSTEWPLWPHLGNTYTVCVRDNGGWRIWAGWPIHHQWLRWWCRSKPKAAWMCTSCDCGDLLTCRRRVLLTWSVCYISVDRPIHSVVESAKVESRSKSESLE